MGSRVSGGLHGTAPSLRIERNQDITYTTDFRSVYATMLDTWLGTPSERILSGKFDDLPIFAGAAAPSVLPTSAS